MKNLLSCGSAGDIASEDEQKHVPNSQKTGNATDKENPEKPKVAQDTSEGLKIGIGVKYVDGKPQVTAEATGIINSNLPQSMIDQWSSSLSQSELIEGVYEYNKRTSEEPMKPLGVYLKDPTPYGNLLADFEPIGKGALDMTAKAEVVSVNSIPAIIATSKFENTSSVVATYNAKISQEVESTIASSWSQTTTNIAKGEISVSAEVFGAGTDASFSYEHKTVDQKGESQSSTSKLTAGDGVTVTLKPGQKAAVNLITSKGTVVVKVTYTLTPNNYMAVWFGTMANAEAMVLSEALPQTKWYAEEEIEINCYSNATVTVSKLAESETLGILGAARTYEGDEKGNLMN